MDRKRVALWTVGLVAAVVVGVIAWRFSSSDDSAEIAKIKVQAGSMALKEDKPERLVKHRP
ncbi:MAG: hypothetical protein GC165_14150 [Armatimonadetes bacterium]|nr:hypothetical protein [Armatimonadota bacterium]MBS1725783.1 hypothetical protein [Armatimonadota bacterium]